MKINKKKLNEADVTLDDKIKEAEKVLDDPQVVTTKGQIETALDRALKINLKKQRLGEKNFVNLLFVGEAGTGKTSRIKAWAAENNVNLVTVLASSMDDTDLGGVISKNEKGDAVVRLATTEMDELEEPRSVLFLDEYNRAPKTVRGTLLTLIQDHVIRDDRVKGKMRPLKNFLFTVAAVNPWDENNEGADELEDAERSRFKNIAVYSDPNNTWQYLHKVYTSEAENADDAEERQEALGKDGIVTALLKNKAFRFDDQQDISRSKMEGNGLLLTARTLNNLLDYCDGTKEDFLANWNDYCNNLKKSMAERILANYQDVEDKANDVLKQDSDSSVFKKAEQSNSGKLRSRLNQM